MPKKTPKRSPKPIGTIVFTKDGRTYPNIELIPGEKDEEELVVVKKLLGAIRHYGGANYRNPRKESDTTEDIVCESEDGSKIEIQVTWTGDDNIRKLREMRSSYVEAIKKEYPEVLNAFRGCDVTLVDSGDPPYLPEVSMKKGQLCLDELANRLMDVCSQIDTLKVGKTRGRKLSIGRDKRDVGIICRRLSSANDDAPCSIRWEGSYPVYGGKGSRATLSASLQKKINMNYPESEAEFWLLIYSTDMPMTENDPDIEKAREILDKHEHPFDIVWYLHPSIHLERGHLIKIWPTDK